MALSASRWRGLVLRLAGSGLLVATGAIHLDLYLTGYRSIPTIGGLFLFQVVTAFALAALVLVSGNWLAATAGAGFALSTLGGYLLALWVAMFGFREVRTTAGTVAGVLEIAAFGSLGALAIARYSYRESAHATGSAKQFGRLQLGGVPGSGWLPAALSVVAAAVLALSLALEAPATVASSGAVLRAGRVGTVAVVTNSKGFTLYWFVPDTSDASKCNGICASYWPPVIGRPVAGPGVSGALGTIKRADSTTQATYDGHPLYTYLGDTAPGQANGNNINLNGGVWHEMTIPG